MFSLERRSFGVTQIIPGFCAAALSPSPAKPHEHLTLQTLGQSIKRHKRLCQESSVNWFFKGAFPEGQGEVRAAAGEGGGGKEPTDR